jgi:hypothetical protein
MPWRVFRVLAGFVAASVAAGVVQALLAVDAATAFATRDAAAASGLLILLATVQSACFSAPFALAGIGLSERMGLHRWVFFVAGGGLVGLAAYAVAIGWADGPPSAFPLIVLVSAGAAGGLVYRLVAGQPRARPSSQHLTKYSDF